MRTLPFLPQHFVEISEHLNNGLPIILPTETSYGFSGNIFSSTAIHAVELIKKRKNKPFLVLVDSNKTLNEIGDISKLSKQNKQYIKEYSDPFSSHTPTTFIVEKNCKKHAFLQNYFPDFTNIGIRVSKYIPLIGFLQSHKTPLFSTSANFSGHNPLYKSDDIKTYFKNIPNILFCDAGDLEKNPPSSIIKFNEEGEKIVLR